MKAYVNRDLVNKEIEANLKRESPVTKHKLDLLLTGADKTSDSVKWPEFKVGTVAGSWCEISDCIVVLAIINTEPGNGHLDDFFEWFEYVCNRKGKNLLFIECVFNPRFYSYLINKREFSPMDSEASNCIKIFNKRAYRKMLKKGNELIEAGTLKCK